MFLTQDVGKQLPAIFLLLVFVVAILILKLIKDV